MGGASSKPAQNAVRKFPTRAPGTATPSALKAARTPAPEPAPAPSPASQAQAQVRAPPVTPQSAPRPSVTKNESARRPSLTPKQDSYSVNPEKTLSDYPTTDFASRLKQMGVAQPNPTYSPSSTASPLVDASGISQSISGPLFPSAKNNPTLGALEARRRLEEKAKVEMEDWGKSSHQGKEFLDIGTIKKIFVLRDQGESEHVIEERLGLKKGVVGRLGRDYLSIAS
ncbi:hypothetical protein QBC40DRAFT_270416 [Triangularia verruculosa]|uniref:Helix-turn-helix domain-containing protein n=1 Tax=Triangularia verruculosa TaxID=2587418 RepID=A0AAN7AP81_9PEZI|nr:hypothetical protein QBC40DRAFT_270416 [Triangularia verruculosa]